MFQFARDFAIEGAANRGHLFPTSVAVNGWRSRSRSGTDILTRRRTLPRPPCAASSFFFNLKTLRISFLYGVLDGLGFVIQAFEDLENRGSLARGDHDASRAFGPGRLADRPPTDRRRCPARTMPKEGCRPSSSGDWTGRRPTGPRTTPKSADRRVRLWRTPDPARWLVPRSAGWGDRGRPICVSATRNGQRFRRSLHPLEPFALLLWLRQRTLESGASFPFCFHFPIDPWRLSI